LEFRFLGSASFNIQSTIMEKNLRREGACVNGSVIWQSRRVQEKSFALTTRIVHDERIPEKAVQASRAVGDQIGTAPQTWAQRVTIT